MTHFICPPNFIPTVKNKFLLLDTNVLRDAASKPSVFRNLFNELKSSGVTLVTLDFVKFELLKGSMNESKYQEKELFIDDIIDAILVPLPETFQRSYDLIQMYKSDGVGLHITDLFLGATLMQYREGIYLMTRDTSDFLQSVFDLPFVLNLPHNKGIFAYGIYQYLK